MFPKLTITTILLSKLVHASVDLLNIDHLLQVPLHESTTDSSPPAPWSHHPHCTTSTHLPTPHRFCVYTSNTTGPYGLSLITTPATARLATADLTTSPLSSFLTHAEAESLYQSPTPWKIVTILGKDKGVIATRRIRKYETFMIDQAAVVVDMRVDGAVSKGVRRGMLAVAVERLRSAGVVRGMSGRHGASVDAVDDEDAERDEVGQVEEDVLATNAFGSTVAGVGTHALFPLISRINHACDPNSFVLFARAGISMAIRAYRDIEEGEEITISYLPLGLPYKERTESIKRWGFTCTCSLCSLKDRERQASDLRRLMIAQSEEKVIELAGEYQVATAITLALDAVELTKDEGLESLLTDEYAMLAMLYLESGDKKKAEEYGQKAWTLLADQGYLGTKDSRSEFSLKVLLDGIEKMGGKGRAWKSMERNRGK